MVIHGCCENPNLKEGGDKFKRNFGDFIDKYHFTDLYTATFYDFQTQEEKWTFWIS